MKPQQSAKIVQLDNSLPREKWVKRISTAWREQLTSIFETGNLLEASKLELGHGEWGVMFQKGELPFGQSMANKLMKIAENDNVRNSELVPNLPVHWAILYELTKLTDEQFDNGIKSGAINPNMQRKDVNALRGIEPKKKEDPKPIARKSQGLDDWCCEFQVRITMAFSDLTKEERLELFEVVKQTVAGLEGQNV